MEFYDEGEGREREKSPTPTKSAILNNFGFRYAEHGPCPGALPAFFGAVGDSPVFAGYPSALGARNCVFDGPLVLCF